MATRSRTRAAALVTAAVMSLGVASPSLAASSERTSAGTAAAHTEKAPAQLAEKSSVKQTHAALAKAKKQRKKARTQLRARTAKLTTAQEVAAIWAADLQTATTTEAAARKSHTLIKVPLDRYRSTIANADADWADFERRYAAAKSAEVAAMTQFEAARERYESLQGGSYGLQVQLDDASASLRAATAAVTNIETVEIPETTDRLAESTANEAKLTQQAADARAAFDDTRAAYPGSELRDGRWGHQVDAAWVPLPELDKLDADSRALQEAVVQAAQARATWEQFLAELNVRLAKAQTDVDKYTPIVASLQHQIANFGATVAAAKIDLDTKLAAWHQARATVAQLKAEGDELSAEIATARREGPALAITEKKLADALATATTALADATRGDKIARAKVQKLTQQVAKAKQQIRKATKQIKRLKKRLRQA